MAAFLKLEVQPWVAGPGLRVASLLFGEVRTPHPTREGVNPLLETTDVEKRSPRSITTWGTSRIFSTDYTMYQDHGLDT